MRDDSIKTSGAIRNFCRDGRSLVLDCGEVQARLTVLTPRIVRVRLSPGGSFAPRRSWAVAAPDERFPEVPFELDETPEMLVLRTLPAAAPPPADPADPDGQDNPPGFAFHIKRNPFRLSFADAGGRVFCADEVGVVWKPQHPEGVGGEDRAWEKGIGQEWRIACHKIKDADEHFFGFGQRTGALEKTGRVMTNWTTDPGTKHTNGDDPLYIAIPVFLSVRPGLAYGIFLNNTWHSRFDMDADRRGAWTMEVSGGDLDYYLFYGPRPADVSEGIAQVLGTMPLPPRWSLGYHQSRWSYASETRVREIASEFRRRDIPCDVIHFDIAYMDGYRVFTWDRSRFPDPAGLLHDLRCEGFRAVTIIDPGVKVDPDFSVYRQGLERDAFIRRASGELFQGYMWPDDSVFPDYTRPDVREWWGNLQQALTVQGVSGIWNDMNEPPIFHQPFSQEVGKRTWGTIDLDARQGPPGEETIHAEVHNLYGSGMAQASYEGLRRHLGWERPFVLTRSAFAGIQRWSACWMGDNNSWWEHLEMALPQLMNMGLSGVPFVGVDIGGFADNAGGELFARWMQYGAFTPFCRGHTTHFSADHEPWAFGERVEAVCRSFLRLRYRLLPYLTTLFWQASQRGTPVLRPLFYHYPDDPMTYQLHDQALLGPFVLLAPIYQPGREHRYVYLPAGEWYDWWSDERIQGPAHILSHAPLERMPLYLRAGAILPMGPAMRFTDEYPLDPLTLEIYPGEGTLTLYEDDGHTTGYERGEYCTTSYRLTTHRDRSDSSGSIQRLVLEIGERRGAYVPAARSLVLRFHAVSPHPATSHPDARYDAEQRTLTLTIAPDGGQAQVIDTRFGLELVQV